MLQAEEPLCGRWGGTRHNVLGNRETFWGGWEPRGGCLNQTMGQVAALGLPRALDILVQAVGSH